MSCRWLPAHPLNLESAVEHGFVGNPGVSGKASFAVNSHSLNRNDKAAGCAEIFTNACSVHGLTQRVSMKIHSLIQHFTALRQILAVNRGICVEARQSAGALRYLAHRQAEGIFLMGENQVNIDKSAAT